MCVRVEDLYAASVQITDFSLQGQHDLEMAELIEHQYAVMAMAREGTPPLTKQLVKMRWPKNEFVREHFLKHRAKATKQWLLSLDICDDTREYDAGLHHLCLLQYVQQPDTCRQGPNNKGGMNIFWLEEFLQSCMHALFGWPP